ncbi:Crp/Fnr family transcriptional regulator [Sphingomonas sp. ASV193]|uniref:Crp/Fnr family transcriptional regulator n=1 Tax=Sphingomonas sp. ASV193 TaxID=3144405 RepID=UPI0032E9183B
MASGLQCEQCPVRTSAACAALTPGERDSLASLGRTRALQAGETLFHAGEASGTTATLKRGMLKLRTIGADGTERIVGLVHPAGFVGELFGPMSRYDVVAIADCELCTFGRGEYRRAIDRFPALAQALLERTSDAIERTRALVDLQSRRSARARVAAFLLEMGRAASRSSCHPAERFDLVLGRGEMAGLLGLTIETVSRQLTALERAGTIAREGRRGIRLADPAALEAIVS